MICIDNIDIEILETIAKWRFLLATHILKICPCSRASTYRRLKKLIDTKYISREQVLYGVPPLYRLAHKGRLFVGLNKRDNKYRLEQIDHDIHVVNCAFSFMEKYNLSMKDIVSERELNGQHGFGSRPHAPDFIFNYDGKSYAVEIELSLKSKERLSKNAELNFLNYDVQIWIIRKKSSLKTRLGELTTMYPNILIEYLEELTENV